MTVSSYPAAPLVTPADANANSAIPISGAKLFLWNGTTWDPADGINGQQKVTLYKSDGTEIDFGTTTAETITANADGVSNSKAQDRTVTRVEKYRPKADDWFRGDVGIEEWTYKSSGA